MSAPLTSKGVWSVVAGTAIAAGLGYLAYRTATGRAKPPATAVGTASGIATAVIQHVAAPKHKEYRKGSLTRIPSTTAPVAAVVGADGPREHRFVPLSVDTRDPDSLRLTLFAVTQPLYFTKQKAGLIPNEFKVITIQGGLTNQLYRCVLGDDSVLVRLYGAATERVIDRERENLIMNVLSANGFGPALWGRFENGRLEGFLPGRSLQPDDMYVRVDTLALATASCESLIVGR